MKQRLTRQSQDYSARCYVIKMKKYDYGPIPDDLPEESVHETRYPILTNIVMTNYGIWITEKINNHRNELVDVNHENKHDYFHEYLEDSIIPISNLKLYYVAYESKGNLEIELSPSKSAGFTEAIPKLQKGDKLKIVIIFTCTIKRNNLQEVIRLGQPIKLKLIVLNNNGNDDLTATAELYKTIYDRTKSFETDDDDSWMYRSRPTWF